MDWKDPMSETPSRNSTLSPVSQAVTGTSEVLPQEMPLFPPQGHTTGSDTHIGSDLTLPDNYASWSSLQINQMKRLRASSDTTALKQPNSSYYSRRRAQNRASQRAFRERKERHVKNLEQQLEDLHHQYKELLRAYDQQQEHVLSLKAELKELHSKEAGLQIPPNSPLDIPSKSRAPCFRSDDDMLQYQENDLLTIQTQPPTPTSNFEKKISTSRASNSAEQTPFGSLLPLTPVERLDDPATFCSSDQFFTTGDSTRCYDVSDYLEAQQHQQEDGFRPPDFKEFTTNTPAGIFGAWR